MKGFTLIELIIVIVIIGILAAIAIPKYVDLVDQANKAARDGMAGAAMSAVTLYYAATLADTAVPDAWPATITSANFEDGTTFLTNFGGYTWAYDVGTHSILTNNP
ncbi:MAG: prepilin-type N-terminal cleavage/methylation domain-containing protein [PVC group bacterium]